MSVIDMATSLGASVLTVVTGGTEPGTKGVIETQKFLADRVNPVADYAANRGFRLALEPLNPMFGGNRTCLMRVRDALDLCQAIAAANFGIAVNVYHVWWDTDAAQACAEAGDRIMSFHLCDWLEKTTDMSLDRGMMGDGAADIKAIRAAVEAAGYTGFQEVEIFRETTGGVALLRTFSTRWLAGS